MAYNGVKTLTWDRRAAELRWQEKSGKTNGKLNAARAQQRADELAARLERRTEELNLERQISATPPVVLGGAIVVPIGLLFGERTTPETIDTRITESIAMQAMMQAEAELGNQPRDVSGDKLGYDVESLDPRTGRLRFIEVKGRRAGADTVTVTRNEILTGINSPKQLILALVEVEDGEAREPRYVRASFGAEPDFGVPSVNYDLRELLSASFKGGKRCCPKSRWKVSSRSKMSKTWRWAASTCSSVLTAAAKAIF